MNTTLDSLFKHLEAQRAALLQQVQSIDAARLNNGKNGKWSISQVFGHVIQAERMSVGYMTKKINAINEVGNTGLWNEFLLGIFIISQRVPLKYKAPKDIGDNPPSYTDYHSLKADWDASRKALQQFLDTVPDSGIHKKIYRHPVMGRCSVVHALKFFREHLHHHRPQILRQL